jgi:hypothetical protein
MRQIDPSQLAWVVQHLGARVRGAGFSVRRAGCGLWGFMSMVQGLDFRVQVWVSGVWSAGVGCRVQGVGYGVQGMGCGVRGVGCGMWGASYGVQGTVCRVRGAGCGV